MSPENKKQVQIFISYNDLVREYFMARIKLSATKEELDLVEKQFNKWFRQMMKWIWKDGEFPDLEF